MLPKRFSLGNDLILSRFKRGDEIRIAGKEQRHLRASRVALNDHVELFDSTGTRAIAMVKSIDSSTTILSLAKLIKESDIKTRITVAVGMPKGARSDWLVEKVTETGASSVIPLEADHSVLKVRDPKVERWERLMIQASKQSLTATPPVLRDRMDMKELLSDELSNYDLVLWGCMPQDTPYNPRWLVDLTFPKRPLNALLVVGPEGDLSNSEKRRLCEVGALPVKLATNRLRTETAAIVMCSTAAMLFARAPLL